MAAVTQAQTQRVYQVAYLSHFTNDTLASEGLVATAGVNGKWSLDTTNNLLTGTRTSTNPRGNVYTTNSWQNDAGFTLYVTFNQQIAGARYSFGLVTSNYTISASSDSFNAGSAGAYGIGVTLCGEKGDALVFNNGTGSSWLSTAQGGNSPGTLESMYITVTSNSYSYSLNGAPATTGSMTFDTSKSFRFVAHAQDLRNQNISSITLTEIAQPVANYQSPTTPEDTAANLALTASDIDSTNLTYAIVSNPANGSLSGLNTNSGAVTYTPTTNYSGADSFTFRAYDGSLYSTGTVDLTNAVATANPDGDAYNNLEEYITGLNPNVSDVFAISNFTASESNTFEWSAANNRAYDVYWSSNLLNGFTLIKSNVPGGVFIDTNHAGQPATFYKITVELKP